MVYVLPTIHCNAESGEPSPKKNLPDLSLSQTQCQCFWTIIILRHWPVDEPLRTSNGKHSGDHQVE